MNNQGLEALAALAAAVPASSSHGTNDVTVHAASGAPNSASSSSAGSARAPNGDSNNANTNINSGGSGAAAGGLQMQWQQAIAAAAANLQLAGPIGGVAMNNPLALLASLQQLSNPTSAHQPSQAQAGSDPSLLLAMQQKLNYLQYLAQSTAPQANSSFGQAAASQAMSLSLPPGRAHSILPSLLNSKSNGASLRQARSSQWRLGVIDHSVAWSGILVLTFHLPLAIVLTCPFLTQPMQMHQRRPPRCSRHAHRSKRR
jgi:hypothetical protein